CALYIMETISDKKRLVGIEIIFEKDQLKNSDIGFTKAFDMAIIGIFEPIGQILVQTFFALFFESCLMQSIGITEQENAKLFCHLRQQSGSICRHLSEHTIPHIQNFRVTMIGEMTLQSV